ncbi:hypothetical protein ILYODFUR_002383 [Ilyodon furcidens]|uniref:Uncharacterized protein n=1 Tax=Ilyodon furcidens TaxID=33524 RepID=A0ABV0T7Z7_9TELE
MWGLFYPRHTTCWWLVFLPAGVLVVLGIRDWVLWCVLAHSWWLLAGAWNPGLSRASAWGGIGPGVSGLWVYGWISSGVDGCRRGTVAAGCFPWDSPLLLSGGVTVVLAVVLLGFLCFGGLWMSVARISSVSGPGGRVCGFSHSLLHIFMEKPYMHMRAHTQTHRCLDSGVNRYTNPSPFSLALSGRHAFSLPPSLLIPASAFVCIFLRASLCISSKFVNYGFGQLVFQRN